MYSFFNVDETFQVYPNFMLERKKVIKRFLADNPCQSANMLFACVLNRNTFATYRWGWCWSYVN